MFWDTFLSVLGVIGIIAVAAFVIVFLSDLFISIIDGTNGIFFKRNKNKANNSGSEDEIKRPKLLDKNVKQLEEPEEEPIQEQEVEQQKAPVVLSEEKEEEVEEPHAIDLEQARLEEEEARKNMGIAQEPENEVVRETPSVESKKDEDSDGGREIESFINQVTEETREEYVELARKKDEEERQKAIEAEKEELEESKKREEEHNNQPINNKRHDGKKAKELFDLPNHTRAVRRFDLCCHPGRLASFPSVGFGSGKRRKRIRNVYLHFAGQPEPPAFHLAAPNHHRAVCRAGVHHPVQMAAATKRHWGNCSGHCYWTLRLRSVVPRFLQFPVPPGIPDQPGTYQPIGIGAFYVRHRYGSRFRHPKRQIEQNHRHQPYRHPVFLLSGHHRLLFDIRGICCPPDSFPPLLLVHRHCHEHHGVPRLGTHHPGKEYDTQTYRHPHHCLGSQR